MTKKPTAAAAAGGTGDVTALIDERRKYESWLATLEARRASTPEHVFERVRGDYEQRLADVTAQLRTHADQLDVRRRELETRIASLDADAARKRDERAECELRAAVGELVGAEYDRTIGAIDGALNSFEAERTRLSADLATVRELADSIVAAPAETGPDADMPEPADTGSAAADLPAVSVPGDVAEAAASLSPKSAPRGGNGVGGKPMTAAERAAAEAEARRSATPSNSFDELAFLSSIVGGGAPDAPRPSTASAPVAKADGAAAAPTAGTAGTAGSAGTGTEAPAAPRRSNVEIAPPEIPPIGQPTPASNERIHAADPSEGLVSRMPRPSTGVVRDEDDPIGGGAMDAEEPPLAANVTGNHPIILQSAASDTVTSKTLKCAECGTMNYPTEWYCERCGAELASM